MKKVAKLVMIDDAGKHLLMYHSDHPRFGIDPDLPGGTAEDNEEPIDCMLREVTEEIGVEIDRNHVDLLYSGSEYSKSGTEYYLFQAPSTPTVRSWDVWPSRLAVLPLSAKLT